MKKTLILSSLATLAAITAMGQGQVNLLNSTAVSPIKVTDPSLNAGAATIVGTAASAYQGAGPGQVSVSIWIATQGSDVATLLSQTPFFAGFNSSSTFGSAQGTINLTGGTAVNLTTANVPGWNGSSPLEILYKATTSGGLYSATVEAQNITVATGIQTPTPTFGSGAGQISSFVLTPTSQTPEPTTIALGGIGAAALLYFRRRK